MALHTVLYRGSVAGSTNNSSIAIAGGPGDVVANNQFLPPRPFKLIEAVGWGTDLSDMRIQTPFLMDMASVQLTPLSATAALASNFNIADFRDWPVDLRANENIDVQASNANVAAQTMNAVLQLWDGVNDIPRTGRRFRARFTGTTTLTAGAWSTVTLTSSQVLPPRTFGVIGIYPRSATGLVMRLDFPISMTGGINFKPGAPVLTAVTSRLPWQMQSGYAGVMGKFTNLTIPTAQWFATAADTAQTVDLDLVTLD